MTYLFDDPRDIPARESELGETDECTCGDEDMDGECLLHTFSWHGGIHEPDIYACPHGLAMAMCADPLTHYPKAT